MDSLLVWDLALTEKVKVHTHTHTHTHIYIYRERERERVRGGGPSDFYYGGARGVMVIVVGIEHDDTSSNPGWDWLHFT